MPYAVAGPQDELDAMSQIARIKEEIGAVEQEIQIAEQRLRHARSRMNSARSFMEGSRDAVEKLEAELSGMGLLDRAVDALSGGDGARELRDAAARERQRLADHEREFEAEVENVRQMEAIIATMNEERETLRDELRAAEERLREIKRRNRPESRDRSAIFANLERRLRLR